MRSEANNTAIRNGIAAKETFLKHFSVDHYKLIVRLNRHSQNKDYLNAVRIVALNTYRSGSETANRPPEVSHRYNPENS